MVLASDWLSNVGHAARDVLLLSAFAREWCGAKPPAYALLESRRPSPWAREFLAAVAASRGAARLAVADGATVCVGGLVQKAAQHVGDAEDARSARDAAFGQRGVAGAAAPDGLNRQPDFNVMGKVRRELFFYASRTRRERSIRPSISRIDFDVTELERFEVWPE